MDKYGKSPPLWRGRFYVKIKAMTKPIREESIQKAATIEQDLVIRTMKGDLEKVSGTKKPPVVSAHSNRPPILIVPPFFPLLGERRERR